MSSIDLGRTLRKLLAAFRTFQPQFSPDRNRNQCTHAAALSPPLWNATHTVVDVHPRASTEPMQGDTDLRYCTYTCTELPRVPFCCHFAMYYTFPEKKISPGIKWSAHVFMSCTYEKVDLGSSSHQNGSEYTLRCRSLLPTISIISLSFGVHGIIYCTYSVLLLLLLLLWLLPPPPPPPPPRQKWHALYHTYIDWKESRLHKRY